MTRGQTVFIALLTALYLCFELAFNARLLDVVGGAPSTDALHRIEVFGRSLSGIAVALVVLQVLLGRRQRSGRRSPSFMAIAFWCALSGGVVYGSLQTLIEGLVATSTPAFRRASLNIVLVQRALVDGRVQLAGLDDDAALFSQPAGKAFLAQFPVMAASVNRLDEKIHDAKLTLITRQVEQGFGGPAGYYDRYAEAVKKTQEQWRRYARMPGATDVDGEVARRQDQAWGDYLSDLGRRGWTPSTVPGHAQDAVRRKVRQRVPVPAGWDLADEATFRDAVATQVRRKADRAGAQSLTVKGRRIPPGLSWPAFFAHPGVQAELRDKLHLPAGVALQPAYRDGAEFQREVFQPLVAKVAREELLRYDAPAEDFADGRPLAERGVEAARAAIVPPVALFFSLLGAVGHLAKLSYLLLSLVVSAVPAWQARARFLWATPFAVLALVWVVLSWTDNAVTQSRLYGYMRDQVRDGLSQPEDTGVRGWLLGNALHVVAVGQGYGYPVNELVRTRLLGGITYGYVPPTR